MPLREDLDLDVNIGSEEALYDYLTKTTYKGSPFYLIWDKEGIKREFGLSNDSDLEEFLSDMLDGADWGEEGEWDTCYNCGEAIWLEDYYSQDYWVDYEGSGVYCGNCVKNVPEIRDAYLEYLTNNPDACNTFLSESQLEDAGLIKLDGEYEHGYYGRTDSPQSILDNLLETFPNGKFIFDWLGGSSWNTRYGVWAFPGYDEGVEDDEER